MLSFFASILKKRPLVGYYDFWVLLTYLSVVSALVGIFFAFQERILFAILCLMVSGICDTFDGRVARLKKRNNREKSYGMHIDSLADLIGFGIVPAVIGYAVWSYHGVLSIHHAIIAAVFVLSALIRLAHFNVNESFGIETEPQNQNSKQKYFEGMPTTTVAVLIPLVFSITNIIEAPFYTVYSVMLVCVSVLYVVRIKIPKPRGRAQIALWLVGAPLVIALLIIGGRPL